MPAAKKKPLDLDVLIAESKREDFTFTLAGTERRFPHAATLTYDQLLLADRDPVQLFPEITDEDTAKQLRAMPAFALEAVVEGWMKHSGVDPGESAASSSS